MMEPSVIISLLALALSIVAGLIGTTWRLSSVLQHMEFRTGKKHEQLMDQMLTINNSMLMKISVSEDALEAKIGKLSTDMFERYIALGSAFADYKLYVERTFIDKATFQQIMAVQSTERATLRTEILERLTSVQGKIDRLGNVQDKDVDERR